MPKTRSSISSDDSRNNLVPTNGNCAKYGNTLEILDSGYSQSAGPSNIEKTIEKTWKFKKSLKKRHYHTKFLGKR